MANHRLLRFTILFLFVFRFAFAQDPEPIEGFSIESTKKQLQFEERLKQSISPSRIEEHLKWLTSRPHRTGTEGAKITADYLFQHLKKFGLQVEMARYTGYLPAPVSVEIQLTKPVQEKIPTTEDRIEEDSFTQHVDEHPGWSGYSPSGEASGQIVYAHHGSNEDLRKLRELGIDLKGKILLMRYFGTGEGRKIRNAEEAGAAAVVLYTDPAEDGFRYGDVYPHGNWRPPGSIMRRSILFGPTEGDPLSPGWGSKPGAKRIRPDQADLPRIPVLPISYRSAERIFSLLNGPVAPYEWQGALGLTYKIGPGPAEVRLRTEMDNRDRPMWNVIARFKGSTYPDQWLIIGNHHDAWIFGAGDPSSGTAALLTLAESLAKLAKEGFRPKRSLILAFWDAEEMNLIGSTEWVEDHEKELLEKAVACINMDSAVFNTDRPLSVSAHPVLHDLFRQTSRNIQDPKSGKTLFERWVELQNEYRKVPGVDGWGEFFNPDQMLTEPYVFESPSDDAAPFFNYLALPASDMYYGADYGMYHSIYENFHWMKTVVDPTFEYHKVMAQLQGFASMRLANADLIPLDYATEADYWRRAYLDLERVAKSKGQQISHLQEALELIARWKQEAEGLKQDGIELLKDSARRKAAGRHLTKLNRIIYRITRDFYRSGGRPDMPAERNIFTGSSYDFQDTSGSTLPGIRFPLDQGKSAESDAEAKIYLDTIQRRITSLQSARKEIQQIR
jgi:N-acetylated-alpha-linked acidic dipeptidase